jgi:cytochrome c oxidase subunit 2
MGAVLVLGGILPAGAAEPRTFEIAASKYKFVPDTVEVHAGETVRFVVHSTDVDHGIGIKAFKVKAKVPKDGTPITVEFVASKAGTYPFTCSEYCGKGHSSMKGTLVVLPPVQP